MASSVSLYVHHIHARLHARHAVIRADHCRQIPANAHVRLARREEVPHVLTLIQQQAEYHRLREKCVATQASLEAGLFDSATAQFFLTRPTVLFLELSPSSFASLNSHELSAQFPYLSLESAEIASSLQAPYPASKLADAYSSIDHTRVAENSAASSSKEFATRLREGQGIAHRFMIPELIKDPYALAFRSAEGRIIAGFALIFQKYISFEGRYGMYIEDLYVREGMRGYGFGTVLFKSVARLAMELECSAVEFRVVGWNKKAQKLYESLGVKLSQDWHTCSLTGHNLEACGSSTSTFADLGRSHTVAFAQAISS